MENGLGEHVVLNYEKGLRVLYEPSRNRCWVSLPPDALGIFLQATADNVAIIYDDDAFVPDWWVVQEQPDLEEMINGLRDKARNAAS